ncbi:MAG: hypothetical protein M1814_001922 [Vezdaea aestivalis]|nr:MAG: hypothetical protein M1814_001922 [Vezdaea aestivalis]
MTEFKIAASLTGHDDDVRGVVYANPTTVVTASRDATVRVWNKLTDSSKPFDATILSHGTGFKNTIAYVKPSKTYPTGLIVAGGQDSIIEVRRPNTVANDDAEALLLGHSHNVCALDVEISSEYIVSGSWDREARIWRMGKWETTAVLRGHEGSVWAVLAWDKETVITGCADTKIRVFSVEGKLTRSIIGSGDVIRALCRVSPDRASGAQFASASNDGMIRLWTLTGNQISQFQAHESFIYSIITLPSGEIASAGEDRALRIWKGSTCVQTITHPAISIWCVAVCAENGDIVSGASDRIARVFTRDPSRFAPEEVLNAFDESVKQSSIPQQQVGDVDMEKLPGPEFLTQKSGTKEGQVQLIKESNGNVTAHEWKVASQSWTNVGTVVDSAGSSGRKQEYLGQDYDFVFDVDIAEGQPPLKLPYNLSQNPYEAGTKFIQENELPMTYLDQVANFIVENTKSVSVGRNHGEPRTGPDPWGTESRYRPDDPGTFQSASTLPLRKKILPQSSYLSIGQANLKPIQKKITELNQMFVQNGDKVNALTPSEISGLEKTMAFYEKPSIDAAELSQLSRGLPVVLRIASEWPPQDRLPGLDLLRLITLKWSIIGEFRTPSGQSIIELLGQRGIFNDADRPNNAMLGLRTLTNLFESQAGRHLVVHQFQQIHDLVQPLAGPTPNRNLTIALTTVLINYSVLLTSADFKESSSSADKAISLLQTATTVLQHTKDSEASYRALVAVGTLLVLGEEVQDAAKNVYDLQKVAERTAASAKEPRLRNLVQEIKQLLK